MKSRLETRTYTDQNGTHWTIKDMFVNAPTKYSAIRRLFPNWKGKMYHDEIDADIENGLYEVEEVNWYCEEDDTTYRWYVRACY